MSHGRIVQGVGTQGSVRAIQMRSQVSMTMVNAPGIYVGFLLGRELTRRKAILKGMGPHESLDTLTYHGIGLARSRLESHS